MTEKFEAVREALARLKDLLQNVLASDLDGVEIKLTGSKLNQKLCFDVSSFDEAKIGKIIDDIKCCWPIVDAFQIVKSVWVVLPERCFRNVESLFLNEDRTAIVMVKKNRARRSVMLTHPAYEQFIDFSRQKMNTFVHTTLRYDRNNHAAVIVCPDREEVKKVNRLFKTYDLDHILTLPTVGYNVIVDLTDFKNPVQEAFPKPPKNDRYVPVGVPVYKQHGFKVNQIYRNI